MLEKLLNLLHRHRSLAIAVAVILPLAGIWKLPSLSVNDSPERWMPETAVANWAQFGEHFEYGDTIVVGLEFTEGVQDDDIDFLLALQADLVKAPGVVRVIDVSIAKMVEQVPLTQLLATPAQGKSDPFTLYRLLYDDPLERSPGAAANDNGRTLLTVIELDAAVDPNLDKKGQQQQLDQRRRTAIVAIYEILDRHRRDDINFHAAGAVVIQDALERIAKNTAIKLVPLAMLLLLVAMGISFRSLPAIAISILGGAWGTLVLLGGIALSGGALNVVTVGAPVLMVVIIVSATIHFAHYYSHNTGPEEASQRGRRRFVRRVALPALVAAIVTGIGFLMLTFNELRPVRELGFQLCAGAVLAFFGAYLAWALMKPWKAAPGKWLTPERMSAFGGAITRRPALAVSLVMLLLSIMGFFMTKMRVDVDPFSFFEKESPVAIALDHFSARKFGHYTLDVVIVPKNLPKDPAAREAAIEKHRQRALAFEKRIVDRPEVRRVISEPNIQKKIAQLEAEAADAEREGRLFARLGVQGRQVILENTFKNWLVDRADSGAIRLTFLVHDTGAGFRPLLSAVRSELDGAEGAPEERSYDYFFTGTAASVAVLSEQLVGALGLSLVSAALCIAAVCLLMFRSLRITLIAFLPNAFPIVIVYGVMGAFGIPLNAGSAMVASIALGVAVNDTVHLIMHYRRRRAAGDEPRAAIGDAFHEIGRPVVLTSIVNTVGFSIFYFSDFMPMHHFGLLAGISMAAALIGDAVLLPNLLILFDRGKKPAAAANEIEEEPITTISAS
jgi:predicted RND superfamily exporter protein